MIEFEIFKYYGELKFSRRRRVNAARVDINRRSPSAEVHPDIGETFD